MFYFQKLKINIISVYKQICSEQIKDELRSWEIKNFNQIA